MMILLFLPSHPFSNRVSGVYELGLFYKPHPGSPGTILSVIFVFLICAFSSC